MAAIMKKSDLEEEDSPEDELLAITCFSQLPAQRGQSHKSRTANSPPPGDAQESRGALTCRNKAA
jgi:hypothetical protein